MTRINTNVGSLIGRNNLQRANASLSQSLTRLSTGLRINTGKDDPAGLIASENLRSDITAIRKAISNTDRANQVIATADSALGQVSSLLNDIRGLVTESANAGALSDEQISANQLQVDSSLEALNRIAQTTTFQGRRLLDGSLDFITTPGSNAANLSSLQIDQANLGATGEVSVDISVSTAATQATIAVEGLPDVTPTTSASVDFEIETTAAVGSTGTSTLSAITTDATQGDGTIDLEQQASGAITIGGEAVTVTALAGGNFNGATGNGAITTIAVDVDQAGATAGNAVSVDRTGTAVTITFAADSVTVQDVLDALAGNDGASANVGTITFGGANVLADGDFTATTAGPGTGAIAADIGATAITLAGGGTETLTLDAVADSNADGAELTIGTNPAIAFTNTAAADSAVYDPDTGPNGTLTINISTTVTTNRTFRDIAQLIEDSGSFTINGGVGAVSNTLIAGSTSAEVDTVTENAITVTSTGADALQAEDVTLDITGTTAAGASGDISISFAEASFAAADPTRVIGNATNGYTVQINTAHVGGVTVAEVRSAIESIDEVESAEIQLGSAGTDATILNLHNAFGVDELASADVTLANGVDRITETATFDLTTAAGETGNINVSFTTADLSGAGTNVVDDGVSGGVQNYTLELDSTVAVQLGDIRAALESISEIGTVTLSGLSSTDTFDASRTQDPDSVPSTTLSIVGAGSSASTNGIDADLVFELAGATGSEVLSFEANTSLQLLIDGVNAVSDATGVTAEANDTDDGIVFTSTAYGSDAIVDIQVIEEGAGGDFVANLTSGGTAESRRETGTDIVASVNGITATGNGNSISINTATLDLSASVDAGFTGTIEFDITGGGALF
ncbi:MAG: flagellin, partial [Planctomycetales bacterium]|nr:flagellin [Planctomycetales bacterium]